MQPQAPLDNETHTSKPDGLTADPEINETLTPEPDHQPVKKHTRIPWLRIVSYLLLIIVFSSVIWKQQDVRDWWVLQSYSPSATVTDLATQTTMTPKGRRIFYVQKPQIQNKSTFYKSCEEGETAIVLGCYKPISGIFILKVDNPKLNGVEQVTAAHEMLHAAYGRLSRNDRKFLAQQLTDAYNSVSDQLIKSKLTEYQKDGADILNELHSILGTEVADLPAPLENYYARYFTNRKAVVAFSAAYQNEFASRKAKVVALDAQLKELQTNIESNNAQLDSQQTEILAESKRLDGLLQSGDIPAYNSGVAAYNKRLVPFRSLIAQTNQLVANYKSLLAQRNAIAAEAQELERSLDSRITTSVEAI